MPKTAARSLSDSVRSGFRPLEEKTRDYDELLDLIGSARFVLLGEATHGTHEFYRERATITRRLIEEKGFRAVAVEADWPDAYRVNRYVRGAGMDKTAEDALGDFQRFPLWMWRNTDVVDFIQWLRARNQSVNDSEKASFYGLDLYSLYASIEAVVAYLEKVDPKAAQQARERYACFDRFCHDPQSYGYMAAFHLAGSCEENVLRQLSTLRQDAEAYLRRDGFTAEDELFFAQQNARLAKNAEAYYRTMYQGDVPSWNIRDRHMAETLVELDNHLSRHGTPAKIVVWEHNSHVGDSSATYMAERGEYNLGQLVRSRFGRETRLIGFTTHRGTVAAASEWDSPVEIKPLRPALPESYEGIFHETGERAFYLPLTPESEVARALSEPRLERAVGVIYLPQTERASHYFHASLSKQFDAVIHFDETRAVEPLDGRVGFGTPEAPETFPFGE